MRYLSLCSGIEAATVAWKPLGWTAVGFSEIEPFPCSVLSHHYPDVPNLGNMLEITSEQIERVGPVDLLVGGTPCQSFSIAGLRGGLADARGNLALRYCQFLACARPRWFVWENVPGVLSSNKGRDFGEILDTFESLGYILDVEILDSQFFGVPQRRRRVFVCGERADCLLQTKTTSSVLTMAQCVVEILHASCREMLLKSEKERAKSASAHLSRDGVLRRMRLFGITTHQEENSKTWQKFLAEEFLKFQSEARNSALLRGDKKAEDFTPGDLLMDFATDLLSSLTEESWRKDWEDALTAARSFTTSTSTNTITPNQISICFRVVLRIASLILHLRESSPVSCGAELSAFAAIQDFTNYARQTNRDLFSELDGIPSFVDLRRQARRFVEIVGYLGDWRSSAAVLFEPESLRGDSSESRQAGKDVTGTLSSRPSAGGGLGTDFDLAGGVLASTGNISHCLNVGGMGRIDYETETLVTAFPCKDYAADAGDTAPTLRAMGHGGSHANAGGQVAIVAFDTTQITSPGNFSNPQPGDACHPLAAGAHPPTVCTFQPRIGRNGRGYSEDVIGTLAGADAGATSDMRPCVTGPLISPRRLTVTECERLQGFEDNYTLVPHRGRQAADSPRYKAIGNSMAVPVMTWIGRRIAQVDQLVKGP